jgi:hypothetical protein
MSIQSIGTPIKVWRAVGCTQYDVRPKLTTCHSKNYWKFFTSFLKFLQVAIGGIHMAFTWRCAVHLPFDKSLWCTWILTPTELLPNLGRRIKLNNVNNDSSACELIHAVFNSYISFLVLYANKIFSYVLKCDSTTHSISLGATDGWCRQRDIDFIKLHATLGSVTYL